MKNATPRARRLRQQQADAERVLWFRLRDRRLNGWKVKRRVPIDRFIVDSCCAEGRLVVERDGGQHSIRPNQDAERTEILSAIGCLVRRFWNNDILTNIDGVVEEILSTLEQIAPLLPHPAPLPGGE